MLSYNRNPYGAPYRNPYGAISIPDAYEDFTKYVETDPAGVLSVSKRKIIATGFDRDVDGYLTDDKGAGAITDFVHEVDVNVTSLTDENSSALFFWAVANASDDLKDIGDLGGDFLELAALRTNATNYKLRLRSCDGGTLSIPDESVAISVGTKVFIGTSRSGTAMTVEIYSTAALREIGGAGDIDTLIGTVVGTAFRYVYAIASYNAGSAAKDISGTIENLRIVQ